MFKHCIRFALMASACAGIAGAKAADPAVREAMYSESPMQTGLQARIADARDAVDGAKSDVADAKSQLASLERGDYSDIVIVSEGEVSKCGKPASYPGCQPLSEADKRDAKAEAHKAVDDAHAELASAEADLEHIEKVKNADAR